jgi:hypothetical protein
MFRHRFNTPFFYNTPSKDPKKDIPDAGGYKDVLPYGEMTHIAILPRMLYSSDLGCKYIYLRDEFVGLEKKG